MPTCAAFSPTETARALCRHDQVGPHDLPEQLVSSPAARRRTRAADPLRDVQSAVPGESLFALWQPV